MVTLSLWPAVLASSRQEPRGAGEFACRVSISLDSVEGLFLKGVLSTVAETKR